MKIYIHTLGCKVNQYESQAIEAILKSKGHELCSKDDDFDAFIVNTCAVTAESGRKSRQIIRQLKASHPDAICAVCRREGVKVLSTAEMGPALPYQE